MPAPAAAGEPLDGVDSAWLKMDEPSNRMVINGVLVFDRPVGYDDLAAVLEERLLPIRRFRQRVVPGGRLRPARWEDDPAFDLSRHLLRSRLGPPGGRRALQRTVSRLMGAPLEPDRPLWRFHLLDGYDGRSALMVRLHHCLGDGIALMMVLLSLTEPERGSWGERWAEGAAGGVGRDGTGPDSEPGSDPSPDSGSDPEGGNPFSRLLLGGGRDLARVRRAVERVMPDGLRLMLHPVESAAAAGRWLKGAAATTALGRLALRPSDPATRFKGPLGSDKRAAWSRAVPLNELREAGHTLGASVNEVVLAAVAGAFRRYLAVRDGPVAARLAFRAAVPVNLRPLEAMDRLGNRFGLVFPSLPVGIEDPLERVAEVRRRMRKLRTSAEPLVTFGILRAMGRGPLALQRRVVDLLASKTTVVMTNVPGPCEPLALAGRTIEDLFFWVPQAGRVGVGVSIMSYAGSVRIGIGTDAGLVPDPETLVAGFEEELRILLRLGHGFDAAWMWGEVGRRRRAVDWVLGS